MEPFTILYIRWLIMAENTGLTAIVCSEVHTLKGGYSRKEMKAISSYIMLSWINGAFYNTVSGVWSDIRTFNEITGFHILGVTSGQSPNAGACKCLGDCSDCIEYGNHLNDSKFGCPIQLGNLLMIGWKLGPYAYAHSAIKSSLTTCTYHWCL